MIEIARCGSSPSFVFGLPSAPAWHPALFKLLGEQFAVETKEVRVSLKKTVDVNRVGERLVFFSLKPLQVACPNLGRMLDLLQREALLPALLLEEDPDLGRRPFLPVVAIANVQSAERLPQKRAALAKSRNRGAA